MDACGGQKKASALLDRVTGGCELSDMDAGSQTQVLHRVARALNC